MHGWQKWALVLLLAALAVLGNYFKTSLFFGLDLIWGSIAVMVAVGLLGMLPGVLVALAGGAYTWLLWGHGYAMVTFGLEALVTGLLLRRMRHLGLANAVFWLFAGAPLVLLFYHQFLGLNWDATWTVTFKQMINGILNALLASFLVQAARSVWPSLAGAGRKGASISALMFNAFLAVGLGAGLAATVSASHSAGRNLYIDAGRELDMVAKRLTHYLLVDEGVSLQRVIDSRVLDEDIRLALISDGGEVLASRGELRSLKSGTFVPLDMAYPGLQAWLPGGGMALLARWRAGSYVLTVPKVEQMGMRMVLERSAAPSVARLGRIHMEMLGLMAVIALVSVGLAGLLSRWLTQPIVDIETLSHDLPGRVMAGQRELIAGSRILEFDKLRQSLQVMADTMAGNFRELRQVRDSLEEQVQVRTAELRQREQALEQFKITLDQTLDCIFMFDAQDLRFIYANQGALDQVGYSRDELFQLHPYDIKPEISEVKFREMLAPLLSGTQKTLTFETIHRSKQGVCLPVEVFIQYVAVANQSPRFVNIVRDISERQRLDRMKSEFVSTVSHELRTPLTSIAGALGLAMGGALGELPGPLRQMLDLAHKNSQRLAHLIDDLLDMEKLAAGKMQFDLHIQPLMPLVEQAIDSTRPYAAQHQVSCVLTERMDGVQVHVDGGRLQQVLANFLSNAAKFSPAGSQVDVRVELQASGWVRVEVKDHGPGIPAQFRDRIFQKFSQADASDTRQKGGTGLGLAISKEFIERMGGHIGFESEEGQGARFYFELAPTPAVGPAA